MQLAVQREPRGIQSRGHPSLVQERRQRTEGRKVALHIQRSARAFRSTASAASSAIFRRMAGEPQPERTASGDRGPASVSGAEDPRRSHRRAALRFEIQFALVPPGISLNASRRRCCWPTRRPIPAAAGAAPCGAPTVARRKRAPPVARGGQVHSQVLPGNTCGDRSGMKGRAMTRSGVWTARVYATSSVPLVASIDACIVPTSSSRRARARLSRSSSHRGERLRHVELHVHGALQHLASIRRNHLECPHGHVRFQCEGRVHRQGGMEMKSQTLSSRTAPGCRASNASTIPDRAASPATSRGDEGSGRSWLPFSSP